MSLKNWLTAGVAAVAVLFTTACPRDIANKVAERESLTKEYNEKADRVNDLDRELFFLGVDIDMSPIFTSTSTFSGKTTAQLEVIRAKLGEFIATAGRMVEIAEHGNMDDKVTASELSKIKTKLASAIQYREIVNKATASDAVAEKAQP